MGISFIVTKGQAAPEVGQIYTRARQLCERLEAPHQLFPALRGLWSYSFVRAELQTAHALGEQLLTLAQQVQDSAMLLVAHRALGTTLFWLGAGTSAHMHFAPGIALYDPQQHRTYAFLYGEDAGVVCHSLAHWTLWYLGYPDQGLAQNAEAVTLAQQMAHPYSLSYALIFAAMSHQFRREVRAAQGCAEAAISISTDQGFPQWKAVGSIMRGWVLTQQGQVKEGIEQLHLGLLAFRATGAEVFQPYFLALLAEAHGTMGQPETGLTVLAEALTHANKTGERWYEPELYRLKGALLLQQSSDNHLEAEACFLQAIAILIIP